MTRPLLFLCMACAHWGLAQSDSVAVQVTARPDTAQNAITLGATVGQIGATAVQQDDAAAIAALSWSGALTLRASQPKWQFDARYEWMRDAGTRFDRWTEADLTGATAKAGWPPPARPMELAPPAECTGRSRPGHPSRWPRAPFPVPRRTGRTSAVCTSRPDGGGRLRYRHRMEALQGHAHSTAGPEPPAIRALGCRPQAPCARASSGCSSPTGSNWTWVGVSPEPFGEPWCGMPLQASACSSPTISCP